MSVLGGTKAAGNKSAYITPGKYRFRVGFQKFNQHEHYGLMGIGALTPVTSAVLETGKDPVQVGIEAAYMELDLMAAGNKGKSNRARFKRYLMTIIGVEDEGEYDAEEPKIVGDAQAAFGLLIDCEAYT